ncbi:MAG: hypothetical protein ACRCZ2_06685 [Fusobacteriaceae bacterium]
MPSSLPSPLAIEPCEATAVVGEVIEIGGGKRYGHYVEVSDTMMANEEFEAKIGISKKNKKTK